MILDCIEFGKEVGIDKHCWQCHSEDQEDYFVLEYIRLDNLEGWVCHSLKEELEKSIKSNIENDQTPEAKTK